MLKLFRTTLSTFRLPGRWRLQLVALLLLVWVPAVQAATAYTFPGTLPPGCSAGSGGNYSCGPLTLGAGTTITITSPTTITVNGNFTTGAGAEINKDGAVANLTLVVVNGITDLGAGTILYGNLIGSLKVDTGNNSKVFGNITTIAGVITIGNNNEIIGNLKTDSAAINIGNNSFVGDPTTVCNSDPVNGNITTTIAGVINVGTTTMIYGRLTTASGAINVGNNSKVYGKISSTVAGAITVGNGVTVACKVSSAIGAITVGSGSTVTGGLSTDTGAITVGNNSNICGKVATGDGAITIGAHATVCEDVCARKTGAITIGADAEVHGNVGTGVAGAITVGTGAQVDGNVETAGAGAITIETKAIVKGGTDADASIAKDATVGKKTSSSGACISTITATFPKVRSREWRQIFMR